MPVKFIKRTDDKNNEPTLLESAFNRFIDISARKAFNLSFLCALGVEETDFADEEIRKNYRSVNRFVVVRETKEEPEAKKWPIVNGYKIKPNADLRGADLRKADLRGADLRKAYLRDANLGGANLIGADLRSADLRGANIRGADLRGAKLTYAKYNRYTRFFKNFDPVKHGMINVDESEVEENNDE